MIRFLKEAPFIAFTLLFMILTGVIFLGLTVASVFNSTIMHNCNNGYVYVEDDKTHGCVSEQVWKESQS